MDVTRPTSYRTHRSPYDYLRALASIPDHPILVHSAGGDHASSRHRKALSKCDAWKGQAVGQGCAISCGNSSDVACSSSKESNNGTRRSGLMRLLQESQRRSFDEVLEYAWHRKSIRLGSGLVYFSCSVPASPERRDRKRGSPCRAGARQGRHHWLCGRRIVLPCQKNPPTSTCKCSNSSTSGSASKIARCAADGFRSFDVPCLSLTPHHSGSSFEQKELKSVIIVVAVGIGVILFMLTPTEMFHQSWALSAGASQPRFIHVQGAPSWQMFDNRTGQTCVTNPVAYDSVEKVREEFREAWLNNARNTKGFWAHFCEDEKCVESAVDSLDSSDPDKRYSGYQQFYKRYDALKANPDNPPVYHYDGMPYCKEL